MTADEIARVIRETADEGGIDFEAQEFLAFSFAIALAENNPQFDREHFLNAAMGGTTQRKDTTA